jgi:hypothetical protein
MPLPPSGPEQRSSVRLRQLRQARCVFNNGSSSLDVMLRNISETGARIAGDALICLPPTFDLLILDGFGGGSSRRVRLVWRNGAAAGVEFIG